IASGDGLGNVHVWDPADPGAEPVLFYKEGTITALAQLADGRLVIGGTTGELRLWEIGSSSTERFSQHRDWIHALHQLDDGRVVSADGGGRVLVWDPDDPRAPAIESTAHVPVEPADGAFATSVAQLADGRVVSAGLGGVFLWSVGR
ncbi:MAG: hypothetical protein AAFN30_09710, partial [Actinomycetota bacterium]